MNTNRIKQQWVVILSSLTLLLTACNEHELPAPPAAGGKTLCFAVSEANTKMTYNGISTSFEDNDTIGCIITIDGSYAANSAWHYNKESGMLIFDYIWENVKNQWGGTSDKMSRRFYDNDKEDNALIINRTNINNSQATDEYITLKKEGIYNFYFYYPHVANDLLEIDSKQATENYQKLIYPNILSANPTTPDNKYYEWYLIGEAKKEGKEAGQYYNPDQLFSSYTWTEFPCFVNHTQTSKAQINNSDFLWISREGITKGYDQTVNLIFQKKMATVEVVSDTPLTDVYFQAKTAESLRRGKEINLNTGELIDYTISPSNNPTFCEKNCYFTADEYILPYDNSDGAGTDYRIVLPPQEAFPCNLTFTLQGTAHTIDLSTQINSLAEGTLYVIHINSRGESTLEIVDWQNEHYEILTPTDNNITTD